jgi:hypothetical protein
MRWLVLFPALFAGAAMAGGAGERLTAAFAVPALLWMPGRGLAHRFTRDPVARGVWTFWFSALLAVPAVLVGSWTGLGGAGTLAAAATVTAATARLAAPRPARAPFPARVGMFALLVVLLGVGWSWRDALLRPLDRHWWFGPAETAWEAGNATVLPASGSGWRDRTAVGWEDALAERLVPRSDRPFLLGPARGPVVIALRGPVGATLRVGDEEAVVRADVVEVADEGAVPRYLDRGVAAVTLDLALEAGEKLELAVSDPARSVVYLLGSSEAVWSLHAEGELRFVHYYQLLNMVEQLHWARELYGDRRVTDVQPPLPSYVLAAPLSVTGGELPTANLVFLLELLAIGLAGLAAIAAWAPRAPLLAWLLPAGAVAMHAKLLLEPGSAMLPDSLYTLGVLGTVGALASPTGRYATLALLAQLTRYPGSFVAAIAGLLAGEPTRVARMLALVLAAAAMFGVGGWLSGSLDGWIATVAWETGPEHWHGEHDPAVLLPRAPRFYALWIAYAGALPLLAALRWPKGTRVALGTALLYSLLLCTIDHTPSHYFLPLVHLSALATACTAAATSHPRLRSWIPLAGLVGISVAYAWAPVVG